MSENIDDIIKSIKNNSKEENDRLVSEMKSKLNNEQTEKLNKLMSNKALMNKLMSSDEIKRLMKKLGGETNGHK